MFRRLIKFLLAIVVGIPLIAIALANRHDVILKLNPFAPDDRLLSFPGPFFVYLLCAMMVGIVLGGMATWMSQSRWRKTARARTQEAYRWKAESERLTKERDARVEAERQSVPQLAKAS